ncbi:hypothetical protein PHSY_005755 [Pseudozyma hubeiensis SY62]|uniref:Uncharacterized protein n=1 Tax=Pseudozyma hubeiensis (strain SY62) TaxID=1305764 RepID=R9P9W4_PSEHS|nr:hypothetical protein PHSY_005755 [Pseudozyma hubeiensis SY62]GAC98166.1 hypothetical protein PHSY_005755 [Pseudozyma hubeiensis SY62]
MSSRRSARASTGKRLSYREDSDDGDAVEDLTEDEYQQDRASTSADDEPADQTDSSEASQDNFDTKRSANGSKRRKLHSSSSASKPPSKIAVSGSTGDDWAPGVTRVVAKLVGPPQSGHVARGELSPNVLKFLADLQANNDRDWFARYDAVYRYCWKNFGEFADAVLNDIMEKVDDTVPWLPTKDLVYRIYRDVRFSNDKTPYKTNLMASFSRGGRKGPFAGYHVLVKPDGRSFFAAGRWQPEREDLATIRRHILEDTQEAQALKAAVSEPTFVKWFGEPKGQLKAKSKSKGKAQATNPQRCNLWGGDDELKVAPKIEGVDKTHKDIDWLKLRSFCVIHNFADAEVLRKDFRQRLVEAGKASEPLVRILNSMTSPDPPPPPESDEEQDDEGSDVESGRSRSHTGVGTRHDYGNDDDDEELVPTESFDYVEDDEDGDDDDEDDDDD